MKRRIIIIAQWAFVAITVAVCVPAVAALIDRPPDPTVALVFIVVAIGCIGNITQWKE